MPTVREIAEPQAGILTPVPRAGPDVCEVCHGRPNPGWGICYSCQQTTGQVSRPCMNVLPFSLYETNQQLWSVLRGYKDSPEVKVRERFTLQVAAFLGVLLVEHQRCVQDQYGGWDMIATVPSTSGRRPGQHPLVVALSCLEALHNQYVPVLAPGPVRIDHNHASDEGFVVTAPVSARRVLLVDDTYTSGARAQSAASALQLAGATVPAIAVVGRVINPNFSNHVALYWRTQRQQPFDFDTCAVERDRPSASDDGDAEDWWDWVPGEAEDWRDWEPEEGPERPDDDEEPF